MNSFGMHPGRAGVSQSDVSHAADALLRSGERPTIDKVRAKIGKGSPNTINPMLDTWWKTLAARLDLGPAAFHRLPEVVAHVAEALWMHATEEARTRVRAELKAADRQNAEKEQTLEVRSHVLTLREGELDSRLRDRDRTIEELHLRLRELTGALRKEQAMRDLLARQIAARPLDRVRSARPQRSAALAAKLKNRKGKTLARRPRKAKSAKKRRRR